MLLPSGLVVRNASEPVTRMAKQTKIKRSTHERGACDCVSHVEMSYDFHTRKHGFSNCTIN